MNSGTSTRPPGSLFLRWFVAASLLLLLLKTHLAHVLDLFGDGAFYWLEAQRWALAYSDHPLATATLIKLGTALLGDSTLGVRSFFLVLAFLIPILMFVWARSLVGESSARWVALLCILIPMVTSLGILAIPDVPLVFLGLASFWSFERAVRCNRTGLWMTAGILLGLGFTVHYRFVLVPLAAAVYLMTSHRGRALLKQRGPWIAALFTLPGLYPILWFNVSFEFSGVAFQLVERHPWTYDASGWSFWLNQAWATTPVLYAGLLFSAIAGLSTRNADDDRPYMLSLFGLTHILVYGLLSPWMDQHRTTLHWPLLGYLPLLIYLPRFVRQHFPRRGTIVLCLTTASVALGSLAVMLYVATISRYASLPVELRDHLGSQLSGHTEVAAYTGNVLERHAPGSPLLVDSYNLGASLQFGLGIDQAVFYLRGDQSIRDGHSTQITIWREWFADLIDGNPAQALLVTERTSWDDGEYDQLLARVCRHFGNVRLVDEHQQFDGERLFKYLLLSDLQHEPIPRQGHPASHCRPASRVHVDSGYPGRATFLDGTLSISGWAFQDDGGVNRIELLVDGVVAAVAEYGLLRPDVAAHYPDSSDPNHPGVGFTVTWDTDSLVPGWHNIAIRVVSTNGRAGLFLERWIRGKTEE